MTRGGLRSLRGRLFAILLILAVATGAAGLLMVQLFQQSATAQIGEAEALVARACDALGGAYRFYTAGWNKGSPALDDPALRKDLTTIVVTALRNKLGIEGGIWQADAGPLAYGFPTYEGGPKTDLPAAELHRIQAINKTAIAEDRFSANRSDTASQTLLLSACPLPGPIPGLSGWAMARVHAFGGRTYQQLMAGLVALVVAVLGAALLSLALILSWSRHMRAIEAALNISDVAKRPALALTGERELDRIVLALNEAGQRLDKARHQAEQLSVQVATSERLAAIGRMTAGIAHEIRNPISAMRLKAEMASKGSVERKDQALQVVIAQVDRLDHLVQRLLTVSERDPLRKAVVPVRLLVEGCRAAHTEFAAAHSITLTAETDDVDATLDPGQMRRALDNLVLNALDAAPAGTSVRMAACRINDRLIFSVADNGVGPPGSILANLFEPFVTGRANGSGLGLSIVRDIAEAHDGLVRFDVRDGVTTFEIDIPWLTS